MTLRLLLDPSLRPPRRGSRMTYLEELPRRVHAHAAIPNPTPTTAAIWAARAAAAILSWAGATLLRQGP